MKGFKLFFILVALTSWGICVPICILIGKLLGDNGPLVALGLYMLLNICVVLIYSFMLVTLPNKEDSKRG